NNLDDITLQKEYAALCGYTQEELENNFSDYIDSAADYLKMTREYLLDQIRYWYNGYTWDGKTAIYNPFSTLKFFKVQEFSNYWFRTGTPTFLIETIQHRHRVDILLEPLVVDEKIFDGYDPVNIGEVSLLFQTGYLTIKQKELVNGRPRYTLGIPNSEVNESLLTCLLQAYGKYPDEQIDELRRTMQQQINNSDESGFSRSLESMIAAIPYDLQISQESYYHSLLLLWMRLLGFKIRGEEHNNIGRSDAVWEQPNLTVVVEIKYHAEKTVDALLNEAMRQIHDRKYYNKYLGRVLLLGIAFSGKQFGCRMEKLKRN
ncbi:MAG: ATP-binding protein, partial [Planctomycetaceae bacterium]|nr:ATP-binding protein [Planctomycetaceae bacterium]